MDRKETRVSRRVRLAAQVAGFVALAVFGTARAGCADAQWSAEGAARVPAVYHPEGQLADAFLRVSETGGAPAIVGLWKFEMISKSTPTHTNPMPDGTLIDFGTAAWHGDGTEFQTSGIRHPSDGDVCQGVWQQVGESTFALNHYALAWTNGTYTGPVNIRARVTVDPTGRRYSGQFVTVVYLASATAGHEFDENTVLATITGTFTATRVTMQ
jgi:hypothetical protein